MTRRRQTNAVDSQALLTNATAKLIAGRIASGLLEPRKYVRSGRASVAWMQPSLEALVPEFLPVVPYDYMSATPLRYRLKPDGSYLLYSVGLDGKDDGGDPSPSPGASPGLWGGRDVVWPSPAAEQGEPLRQPEQ